MRTVRDLLQGKGREVWTIGPQATVYEALKLMAERKIGAVVVSEGDHPLGILSERDYARKVVLLDRSSRETRVDEIMSPNPCCVTERQTIEECMALMTERRFRHLPVIEGERLVGIVSIGDIVKAVISEQKFVISQLENYITRG